MVKIETAQLIVRPMVQSDVAKVVQLFNEPAIIKYLGPFNDAVWLGRRIKTFQSRRQPWEQLSLALSKSTGEPVGMCTVRKSPLDPPHDAELSFAILSTIARQGFGMELAQAVVDCVCSVFGKTHLVGIVKPDNDPIIAFNKKLGATVVPQAEVQREGEIVFSINPQAPSKAKWETLS